MRSWEKSHSAVLGFWSTASVSNNIGEWHRSLWVRRSQPAGKAGAQFLRSSAQVLRSFGTQNFPHAH